MPCFLSLSNNYFKEGISSPSYLFQILIKKLSFPDSLFLFSIFLAYITNIVGVSIAFYLNKPGPYAIVLCAFVF